MCGNVNGSINTSNFFIDNQAVVSICNCGYTRDGMLATYIRNIWLITSIYDMCISVKHIAGNKNIIADLLSRWENNCVTHLCKLYESVPNYEWQKVSDDFFRLTNAFNASVFISCYRWKP